MVMIMCTIIIIIIVLLNEKDWTFNYPIEEEDLRKTLVCF